MTKRGKLEIIKDILPIIRDNKNSIKTTPLLRKSGMSFSRFKEYYNELLERELIKEIHTQDMNKKVTLTERGFRLLEKYQTIVDFIKEFDL
jgi:predicted transcriptional regulator